eukprot:TRINITY_DN3828_c0_g1_i1.p1 TRINITY_DN3828_c0_g1~~TRINITY_DN3828_c0_g1_i1.p1  ORF type:complete len:574 (+),score=101.65 TRINITY_DN3828_c0_g1_i1:32-1723(+)
MADGEPPKKKPRQVWQPALATYRSRLAAASQKGDWVDGVAVFDDLAASSIKTPPDVVTAVLRLCSHAGAADSRALEAGFRVAAATDRKQLPEAGVAELIRLHCCRRTLDDVAVCFGLLDEMRARGLSPKRRTFSPIFEACTALGAVEPAFRAYAQVQAAERELTEFEFQQLVRVAARAHDAVRLHHVLVHMRDALPSISPATVDALAEWFSAANGMRLERGVEIDDCGHCPSCKSSLRPADLTPAEREKLLSDIRTLPRTQKTKVKSLTVGGVSVRHEVIDRVARHFEEQGERVLLVLHERHVTDGELPASAVPIVARWREKGLLYATPKGLNDDFCWLYAAVWSTGIAKAKVITRDQMRDHHFQLLSHKSFTRWRHNHRVGFSLNELPGGASGQMRFAQPPVFTNCIQCDPPELGYPALEITPVEQADPAPAEDKDEEWFQRRQQKLDAFVSWVEQHGPFDVIIDGANVGYTNVCAWGGEPYRAVVDGKPAAEETTVETPVKAKATAPTASPAPAAIRQRITSNFATGVSEQDARRCTWHFPVNAEGQLPSWVCGAPQVGPS